MAKIQKKSKQQFHLIPFFYFPPKDCPSEGAATPTRLCRLPEQELHQQSSTHTNITILPQIAPNSQKRLVENILPQIAQIFTDVLSGGAAVSAAPTKQTIRGYGILPYPHTSVKICAICGRLLSARRSCGFCVFRGRLLSEAMSVQRRPLHPLVLLQAFHLFYWQA